MKKKKLQQMPPIQKDHKRLLGKMIYLQIVYPARHGSILRKYILSSLNEELERLTYQ